MQKKNGVSLIVLVITIIVMVILAGVIVLTLNNSGIIQKASDAVEQTNLATVKELAQMAWGSAYATGARTVEELKAEVDKALADSKIDTTKYIIEVTEKGVKVQLNDGKPNWVVATVDGVPIPKGFVASGATGENTKNGGLVIYEGTAPVTDANVEQAKRERNQYVWVPVEDFSKFVRMDFTTNTVLANDIPNGYWEAVPGLDLNLTKEIPHPDYQECMDIVDDEESCSRYPKTTTIKLSDYISVETLNEVTEMYESVKEYKGFYIARYEAGVDFQKEANDNTIHSKMNKEPLAISDEQVIEMARGMYLQTNSNYGVVSTLVYGVQWDSVVQWLKDKGTNILDSINYGIYYHSEIPNSTFNNGAKVMLDPNTYEFNPIPTDYSKSPGKEDTLFTTGATEKTRVSNIYDLAGNKSEKTMEQQRKFGRVSFATRGGNFWDNTNSVFDRSTSDPGYGDLPLLMGFRSALYIKK